MHLHELLTEIQMIFDVSIKTRKKRIDKEKSDTRAAIEAFIKEIKALETASESLNTAKHPKTQGEIFEVLIFLCSTIKDKEIKLEIDYLLYRAVADEEVYWHLQQMKDAQDFQSLVELLENATQQYLRAFRVNKERKALMKDFLANLLRIKQEFTSASAKRNAGGPISPIVQEIALHLRESNRVRSGYFGQANLYNLLTEFIQRIEKEDSQQCGNLTNNRAKKLLVSHKRNVRANLLNNPNTESDRLEEIKKALDKKFNGFGTFLRSADQLTQIDKLRQNLEDIYTSNSTVIEKEKEIFLLLFTQLTQPDIESLSSSDDFLIKMATNLSDFLFGSFDEILKFGLKAIKHRAKYNVDLARMLQEATKTPLAKPGNTGLASEPIEHSISVEIQSSSISGPAHNAADQTVIEEIFRALDNKLQNFGFPHRAQRKQQARKLQQQLNSIYHQDISVEAKAKQLAVALHAQLDKLSIEDNYASTKFSDSREKFIFESLRDIVQYGIRLLATAEDVRLAEVMEEIEKQREINGVIRKNAKRALLPPLRAQ